MIEEALAPPLLFSYEIRAATTNHVFPIHVFGVCKWLLLREGKPFELKFNLDLL